MFCFSLELVCPALAFYFHLCSDHGQSSCSKTLCLFSACYFLVKNILCSELIICCYNMDIKDLLSPSSQSYVRLQADSKDKANIAKIKLIKLLQKVMNQITLIKMVTNCDKTFTSQKANQWKRINLIITGTR